MVLVQRVHAGYARRIRIVVHIRVVVTGGQHAAARIIMSSGYRSTVFRLHRSTLAFQQSLIVAFRRSVLLQQYLGRPHSRFRQVVGVVRGRYVIYGGARVMIIVVRQVR